MYFNIILKTIYIDVLILKKNNTFLHVFLAFESGIFYPYTDGD